MDYLDDYLNSLSRHQGKDPHEYVKIASGVWWDIVYRYRPSETPGLTGAVVDKARECGVPVPLNEKLVEMIYEIEGGQRSMGWENLEELDTYRQELGLELP
jgi:2-dehydropantoate 2-reductase